MTDSWDRTIFDKELKGILQSKLPISASKISSIQKLATSHPKHHNYIVQCITRFIETSPPDYRLAGLYVIDAISRAAYKQQRKKEENNEEPGDLDGYLKRFTIVLKEDALKGCFEPCSTKDKEKVKKTLDFWDQGSIYPKDMVDYVKRSFLNPTSLPEKVASPTPPPNSVDTKLPPVDTAQLLATLSNIGNGSLSNLNIPGMSPAAPQQESPQPVTTEEKPAAALPPALAKLLGGLVNSPSESPPPQQPNDPRHAANDPRNVAHDPRMRTQDTSLKGVWPPPQGPSIPKKMDKKSRWSPNQASPPVQQQQWSPNHSSSPMQQQQWNQNQNSPPAQHQQWNSNHAYPPAQWNPSQSPPRPQQNWAPQQQWNQQMPVHQQRQQNFNQQQGFRPQGFRPQGFHPQQQHQQYNQPPTQQFNQSQYNNQQFNQPQNYGPPPGTEPFSDPSLPPGCIRVLTRTLYIGPIPDYYDKNEVSQLFSKYGEIASIIVSKKAKGRHNAFLKFKTRAATETAKYESEGLVVDDVPVKVNWAFGFGPKKHFNYDRGDSIIPLNELSHEEKDNLVTAPLGGFQGQAVRDLMAIEEPEAAYRPEWKNGDNKRGMDDYESNNNRKKTRFNDFRQNTFA